MITPQYISDLISWGAIGARTTESQIHRELASGLSCPVGFKNSTNGSIQVAIDAIGSSSNSHIFLSITKEGKSAIFNSSGNKDCHVILRGGETPNYSKKDVQKVKQVSGNFSFAHGDPIHIGNPNEIGINNILSPDWGDSPRQKKYDEEYIFWACGVTPQNAIIEAKIPFCITHTPGHMLITDISENSLHN